MTSASTTNDPSASMPNPLTPNSRLNINNLFDPDSSLAPVPVPRDQALPLSLAQQRLWFISQLNAESYVYNLVLCIRLTGQLNRDALQHSLNAIIMRHEILRTNFRVHDRQPVQEITPSCDMLLSFADLSHVPARERETIALQQVQQLAQQPFDLRSDLLIRAELLHLDMDQHILTVVMHHIVADHWSLGIFYRELAELYAYYRNEQQPLLTALPIQYADVAVWQRQWLQGPAMEHVAYWQQQLANTPDVFEVPADHPRPLQQSFRGAQLEFKLPASLSLCINPLCEQEQVTDFTVVLAAFQAVLHRYTGQTDMIVGSSTSGRTRNEFEQLIGLFSNMLVLRTDLSGNPTFRSLLRQVREVTQAAYAHQDTPFEKLIEEFQSAPNLGHHPLFQIGCVMHDVPVCPIHQADLQFTPLHFYNGTTTFDIVLHIKESSEALTGWFEYNTDLFNADTIIRLAEHFHTLLEAAVANPDLRLAELPLLTAIEREQLLSGWNRTQVERPQDDCLHDLFVAQAARTPDAPALVYEGIALSYHELNQRTDQLAHYLQQLGVGPDTIVPLCVERSVVMVIGILGILKAGGAYLPLDPDYPQQRLAVMLAEVAPPVVLTQQQLVERLPSAFAPLVCLDTDWLKIAGDTQAPLRHATLAQHLAYVIYTSGSTGQPKGVAIGHRQIVNYVRSILNRLALPPGAGFALISTFSADLGHTVLFPALCSGGCLHIISEERASNGYTLMGYFQRHTIDCLKIVPSHFAALLQAIPDPALLMPRQRLILGGEASRWEWIRELQALAPDCVIFNHYGPTETTVGTITYNIPQQAAESSAVTVPLGRPLANTSLYVLDKQLEPVPIGIPGELYIGGVQLARGYINRPDLTAERFIPNPFGDEFDTRLYQTGDLVRYRADGTLEFLGRRDHQVKIRGFRIEVREIEATLTQHPALREAVVLARDDTPSSGRSRNKQLVAYVVVDSYSAPPTTEELRSFLKERVPAHFVPAAFVVLAAIPLTSNGKVDWRKLPALETIASPVDSSLTEPDTPIEIVLASIWQDVLGLEHIDIHRSFFEIGGHSLLAMQVMARIRESFQIDLSLRQIFEAPTIAQLRVLVEQAQSHREGLPIPPLEPQPREQHPALSFSQQRLWLLQQLDPESAFYNEPKLIRLHGPLNITALNTSLTLILERHETLRTTFRMIGDAPIQVIHPARPIEIAPIIVEGNSLEERETHAWQLINAEVQHPFDLTSDLLLRASLYQLTDEEHWLLVTLHHISSDGRSSAILFKELTAFYADSVTGQSSSSTALPVQYADFALWQREWLRQTVLEQLLSYWTHKLQGAPEQLVLPTDYPRPSVQRFRGAVQSVHIPQSLMPALYALTRQEQSTLFMTLLTAFNVLLYRYTGQTDLLIGSPIAGRNHTKLENLIGFFVNTLVFRTDLSHRPTFRDLLRRVRQTVLEAYTHQDMPFELLVEELAPQRSLSYSPLVQVVFVLQQRSSRSQVAGGVHWQMEHLATGTAKFDLLLELEETTDGLRGSIEYDSDLFAPATITRLISHFETLLHSIVNMSDTLIDRLPVLTTTERQQLVIGWNATSTEYPRAQCIPTVFAAQVQRAPDAIALLDDQECLTYAELDCRANHLADELRRLGVNQEVLVGICLDRSVHLIVGLLAILKAGGAYVPLDPTYPQERLAFMLQDTQAPVILTDTQHRAFLPTHTAHVLCLDTDWGGSSQATGTLPLSNISADTLAYVMYTSGSTGQPKGTSISHRAILRLVCNTNYIHLTPDDRVALASNTAFDAATLEIWGGLLSGARLIVVPKQIALDHDLFLALLREHAVTMLFMTTAWFNKVASLEPAAFRSLRYMVIGGEAGDAQRLRMVLEHGAPDHLINGYGPTESTTFAASYEVTAVSADATSIPIGRPLANTEIYLLDSQMEPVPIGVPGELYIGGDGLARGYFARPALTAEKFIPNPFRGVPGARLYRTGDLARYYPDGNIEFLGRVDQQVKIRGFRIELEEIEFVLRQHPDLRDAVVIVREDTPGDKRLVAYVATSEALWSVDAGREFLRTRVPAYMVPSAFVTLEALPLTPNGKLDRKALPVPAAQDYGVATDGEAPQTPVEAQMALIWREVLGLDVVERHKHFFELGGHSLLATQVMTRIQKSLGVDLPLRALFESPTIADLAERVTEAQRQQQGQSALPIMPADRTVPLPLSFAQQRLWFIEQLMGPGPAYHVASCVHIRGTLNIAALEQALHAVAERHEVLRTAFASVGGHPTQVIQPETSWALRLLDLRTHAAAEREVHAQRLIREEIQQPFDMSQGLLKRAALLCLGDTEYRLILIIHHIILDGWSMSLLFREISSAYAAYDTQQMLDWTPLPIQYADYAVWQRQWLQGEVVEQQLAYWRQQLAAAPVLLALPTDRPRPAVQSLRGTIYTTMLSADLAQALKRLSQREGVTLFMTLFAAFNTLLYRYTGQTDLLIGSPIAGRNRIEIEALIGFFVNVLVLRTNLAGGISFRELLHRVRTMLLDAHAHQDIPFEKLVEELAPERNLSYTPLFQVVFDLQILNEQLALSDLEVSVTELDTGTVKQDLALVMTDTGAGLEAKVRYCTDLFDETTIIRLVEQFQILLQAIVAMPEQRLEYLPLLPEHERCQLLIEWNATTADYPQERCFHQYIEAYAADTPNAIAVVAEQQLLTYGELNRKANQLARMLRRRGVGPDTLVALCVDRSLETIIGLLGVLKAGGAYVPLDPTHPPARLARIFEELRAPVLLTQQHLSAQLPASKDIQICLDSDWPAIAREDDSQLPAVGGPDHLAYVIYTSGSTGAPKGVLVSHRGLGNVILAQRNLFAQTSKNKVLQFAAMTFDASVFEITMALGSGAQLYLTPPHASLPGQELVRLLAEQEITTTTLTPTTLGALPVQELPMLRTVTVAGEACSAALAAQWSTQRRFFNLYGPTETTIWATVAACDGTSNPPPIGRPIANTQLYVLDQHLELAPIGVPGELHIDSVGLARGYLGRPDLTAEKFIPNLFSSVPGQRLYKTGDLVRYRPDGNLEFLGRLDHQVKIRGFRIELGEVERALNSHPTIQDVIVIDRDDGVGNSKRLVGYVVPKAGHTVPTGELRQYLKQYIPEYMIPAVYLTLDTLPLNSSGKVDRRALPAPHSTAGDETTYVAPRNKLEQTIAALWQEYLQVEQVGVDDNFFDIGGHSLLIVQIHDRLRTVLQRDFSIVHLLHHTTISALAHYLATDGVAEATQFASDQRANKFNEGKHRLKQLQRKQRPT